MEFVVYFTKLLGEHWLVLGGLSLGSFVLGALVFGRGYKKRIAALEARASMPAINQTFNFNAAADGHDHVRQLREAIEAKTTQSLKKTIRGLSQIPLGDDHTYARLPDGTNIVSMADGSFRLAIPIIIEASFKGSLDGSLSVTVEKIPAPKHGKSDDG